jgi:hypothetical protein
MDIITLSIYWTSVSLARILTLIHLSLALIPVYPSFDNSKAIEEIFTDCFVQTFQSDISQNAQREINLPTYTPFAKFEIASTNNISLLNKTRLEFEKISNNVRKYTQCQIHLHFLDSYRLFVGEAEEVIDSLSLTVLPKALSTPSPYRSLNTKLKVSPDFVFFFEMQQEEEAECKIQASCKTKEEFRIQIFSHLREVLYYRTAYIFWNFVSNDFVHFHLICLYCDILLPNAKLVEDEYKVTESQAMKRHWDHLHSNLHGLSVVVRDNGINIPDHQVRYNCEHRVLYGMKGYSVLEVARIEPKRPSSGQRMKVVLADTCTLLMLEKKLNFTILPFVKYMELKWNEKFTNMIIKSDVRTMWTNKVNTKLVVEREGRRIWVGYCGRFQKYKFKIFVHRNASKLDLLDSIRKPFDPTTWGILLMVIVALAIQSICWKRISTAVATASGRTEGPNHSFFWIIGALFVQYNPKLE